MRIDSSFSGHIDVNPIGKHGKSIDGTTSSIAAGEVNSTVKDFKRALGKEDFDLIIDSLKCIPTDLTFTRLEFEIHDDTKRVMVKIFDRNSDELISEIPPEQFLDLIAGLWKQAGLLVDEKV